MRCRIHRGCHEIGGNCVEVESQGKRIILDIGLPLKSEHDTGLPDISGLTAPDGRLLGIFISHPHTDHYGLLEKITVPVPVYMGAAAQRIINAEVNTLFTPLPSTGKAKLKIYEDKIPIHIGPFTITPYQIDHSAYDSYCLLVEAEGKRLLYSGDIRGHGRNSDLFREFINNPPRDIDVLICEGTQIGRNPDFAYPDENSVEDKMAEFFGETKGMALVWCSAQNIDRLISVWRASRRAKRKLILDVYTAEIIRVTKDKNLPSPGKEGVKVFLPHSQRTRIIQADAVKEVLAKYYRHRIYPEYLPGKAPTSVMLFRPSMLRDLKRAECLHGASLVSSLWSGYLPRHKKDLDEMQNMGIRRIHIHTSGHATVDELRQFVEAIPTSRIVPIHLEDREGFADLSSKVELRNDHEWWNA